MTRIWTMLGFFLFLSSLPAQEQTLTPRLHHLRLGEVPEWATFPKTAEGPGLKLLFPAAKNEREQALRLRQQDVKQTWKVLLNGKALEKLTADENDMVLHLPVPPGALVDGENQLVIEQGGKVPDDIRVGEMALIPRPVQKVLSEAAVEISVFQRQDDGTLTPLPCRLTILDARGALTMVGAVSKGPLAVRPGVIYTGTGAARFGLPAGEYTIFAGRGFEYGIDSVRISLKPGDAVHEKLTLRREVNTKGYVSSDPHVHTLTYSGHGDATAEERMAAAAGEGIELPVATEHNKQVDYHETALKLGLRKYFTPIVGNEVTTTVGHFIIFPVKAGGPIPDYKLKDWKAIGASIKTTTAAPIVILNHARDLHSGFRPLGPERHLALTGEDLEGWALPANAMEIVNSGAQQSDVMRLVHDWLGLLNRGIYLTPVGASDSHDVARHFIGQARTYIQCRDENPGEIDVDEAVAHFLKGKVLVSCGLLAEIQVNGKFEPGDLAPVTDEVTVAVRVLGPTWVKADRVELFANGIKVREANITGDGKPGLKWEGTWKLPRPRQDTHLVVVASGPGVEALYWPIAKPYQPTSPVVERRVIGVSGAVWLDGDGDGKRSSAFDYARRLFKESPQVEKLLPTLAEYDEAVAQQAAGLLQGKGISVLEPDIQMAAKKAGPHVERAFQAFAEAWRASQIAKEARR